MNLNEFFSQLDHAKLLVLTLVMTAFYYFAVYDDGTSLMQEIEGLNQQKIQNESNKKKVEEAIQVVQGFSQKMTQLGDKFDKLVRYIPENFTTTEQMKIISNEAKAAGTSILSLSDRGLGKKYNFYEELMVDVSLKGSYSQIILFLSYLTKIEKVLVLKDMKLVSTEGGTRASGEASPSVTFTGTIIGYRFIKEASNETQQ